MVSADSRSRGWRPRLTTRCGAIVSVTIAVMFHADMSTRHPNVPALEFGHLSVFGIGLEQPTFVGSQQKRLTTDWLTLKRLWRCLKERWLLIFVGQFQTDDRLVGPTSKCCCHKYCWSLVVGRQSFATNNRWFSGCVVGHWSQIDQRRLMTNADLGNIILIFAVGHRLVPTSRSSATFCLKQRHYCFRKWLPKILT